MKCGKVSNREYDEGREGHSRAEALEVGPRREAATSADYRSEPAAEGLRRVGAARRREGRRAGIKTPREGLREGWKKKGKRAWRSHDREGGCGEAEEVLMEGMHAKGRKRDAAQRVRSL